MKNNKALIVELKNNGNKKLCGIFHRLKKISSRSRNYGGNFRPMKTSQQMINNRYRVTANIGADKTGFFLSLQDTENGKKYYTKLVRIDDAHLSAKALYEIQMRVQRLSQFSHTNAVSICESELAPEGLLLRQTELPGYSLKKLMQMNGRPLPAETAWAVALDIASVLAALHSEGLIHGELDPSHIWIDDQGKNYLSFLELPPAFDTERSVYQMPELTSAQTPPQAADIFAFGILMMEMCTGLSAYRSSGEETDVEEYSRVFTYYRGALADSVAAQNPELNSILSRCLTDSKDQRFKNGEELYWAIREVLEKNHRANEKLKAEKEAEAKKQAADKKKKASFDTDGKKKKPSILPYLLFGILFIGAGIWYWIEKPDLFSGPASDDAESTPAYRETMDVLYITQTAVDVSVSKKADVIRATNTPEPTETPTPVPTATEIPRPITALTGRAIRWNADGSVMAAVPASSFTMGMDHTFGFELSGILPSHSVSLDAFWIDRTEVTQAQYAQCVGEGVCQPIGRIADEWIGDDLPIMNVKWTDAQTYCAWAGKRLPTEAEWEKAARSDDRRLYPWGNASYNVGTLPNRIHTAGGDDRDISPYGVMDMAGNVSEWVNDFYSDTRLMTDSELVNPIGPISGNMHTVKGGSFLAEDPETSRFVFNRFGAAPDAAQNYGFRCAVSAGEVSTAKAVEEKSQLRLAEAVNIPEHPADCTNRARFVDDVTIPDGTLVTRGEWITKTWKLENYGTCPWSWNYKVVWNDPDLTNQQRLFDVGRDLQPGEQAEISVSFPVQGNGATHISFLLADTNGETFGLGPQMRGDLYIEYRVSE